MAAEGAEAPEEREELEAPPQATFSEPGAPPTQQELESEAAWSEEELEAPPATFATQQERVDASFHGPCKALCRPVARCCVSADGNWLCCCVPAGLPPLAYHDYVLPLGLHMCL